MKQRAKRILVVVAICLTPVAVLAFLFFFNPLAVAFRVTIEVVNETGSDVWVTPVATPDRREGDRHAALPRVTTWLPSAIPLSGRGRSYDIRIRRGESAKIAYVGDHLIFRHVLVHGGSGDVRMLTWRPQGPKGRSGVPLGETFTIPPLTELPKAPAELIPCTRGEHVHYSEAAPGDDEQVRDAINGGAEP